MIRAPADTIAGRLGRVITLGVAAADAAFRGVHRDQRQGRIPPSPHVLTEANPTAPRVEPHVLSVC
jgi:hypothetical protein